MNLENNTPATPSSNPPEKQVPPNTTPSPIPAETQVSLTASAGPQSETLVTTSEPESSTKIPKKNSFSVRAFISILVGSFSLAFIAFYIVLILGLMSGDLSNPIFAVLDIQESGLKNTLIQFTNISFGTLSLILFFIGLTLCFRWLVLPKEAVNKKSTFQRFFLYVMFFILDIVVWIFMYNFIANIKVKQKAYDSFIQTNLDTVVGLTSPIDIEFTISDELAIRPENIVQILWDFDGDETTDGSGKTVTHTFADKGDNLGRYTVTAYVYHRIPNTKEEKLAQSKIDVVIDNEALKPFFSVDVKEGEVPLEVQFDASDSVDPDGSIVSYEWDLDGDGVFTTPQDSPTISYIYTKPGKYEAKLRVRGSNANDVGAFRENIIVKTPSSDLKAQINSINGWRGSPPFRVRLDASDSFIREGEIKKFIWKIAGEKEEVISRSIERTFRKEGEYEVTLIVENDLGERSQTKETIIVIDRDNPGIIKFKTNPPVNKNNIISGKVPFEVQFDVSGSDVESAVEWSWDFNGDGVRDASGEAVKYIFRNPGEYEVELRILDSEDNEYTKKQKVIVTQAGLRAKISVSELSGSIPFEVKFDGSGSATDNGEIINYIWEFPGEPPLSYGSTIRKIFSRVGLQTIKLTVLASNGDVSSTEITISVRQAPLIADFVATPITGYAPLVVQFDPSKSQGTVDKLFWSFGDSALQSQEYAPKHTYENPGTYTAELKIIDKNNIVSRKTQTITVESK